MRLNHLFLILFIALLSTKCQNGGGEADASADCGNSNIHANHDTDQDGLSDLTEKNNKITANYYSHLDEIDSCDHDGSCAGGTWYSGGCIDSSFNLDDDDGTGYIHFTGTDAVDTDDWGTLDLINTIEQAGRDWGSSSPPIQVGDLSLQDGGNFGVHASHQNGLEGDFRYARSDGKQLPLHLVDSPSTKYSSSKTKNMMAKIIDAADNFGVEVKFIFVDKDQLGFDWIDLDNATNTSISSTVLNDEPGHSNHFHVRLENNYPKNTSSCGC